jgi:hypothetical protein
MVPKSDLEMYIKLYHEVEDELASIYDKLEQAEIETAKKIFADVRCVLNKFINGEIKFHQFNAEFLNLMMKYKVED